MNLAEQKTDNAVSKQTELGLLKPSQSMKAIQGNSSCMTAALRAYGTAGRKSQEDLVTEFLPLVHRIVSQVTTYLRPPLSREDLVSAGCIGLVKAARDYDPTKEADFKTYAYIRIRGAVIDELRSWSFTPNSTNRRLRELEQVCQDLQESLGFQPDDDQIAEAMGISHDELYKLYDSSRGQNFLSIHRQQEDGFAISDSLISTSESSPDSKIDREELVAALTQAIMGLPEKQRQIIVLYYQQELTMKEISEVLDVTESRVSQLHASAIYKLQTRLKAFDDSRE